MKKVISLLLIMIMALSLCACGDTKIQKELLGGHKWGENEAQTKQVSDNPIEINGIKFKIVHYDYKDGKLCEITWQSSYLPDMFILNGRDTWGTRTTSWGVYAGIEEYGKEHSEAGEKILNELQESIAEMTGREMQQAVFYIGDDSIKLSLRCKTYITDTTDGYFEIVIKHFS